MDSSPEMVLTVEACSRRMARGGTTSKEEGGSALPARTPASPSPAPRVSGVGTSSSLGEEMDSERTPDLGYVDKALVPS